MKGKVSNIKKYTQLNRVYVLHINYVVLIIVKRVCVCVVRFSYIQMCLRIALVMAHIECDMPK